MGQFLSFIRNFKENKDPKIFFSSGSDKNSIFASNRFISNVLVLELDGSNW